ncbi:MAG: molybdate ABC transporter substrate-binding protein [Candidatus Nealsonbacteria bacterium]|nr:molybdate ABC transporter substrate-binding protein [Candidatus Nealsonbacteria bacterium]
MLVLVIFTFGCGADTPRLYCGAGIRPPVAELVEKFEQEHGVTIKVDYAGSEVLLSRIKLSGKGDLYMPGDVHYVEQAKEAGLIATSEPVCYFVPVILVQKDNPKKIHTLDDLTRADVKVGLGDPKVCAIGRKASKIFVKNEIDEEKVNVKYRSATVNNLGTQIKLDVLDAVIVWGATAAYFAADAEVVTIPPEKNVISKVAVGVLKSAKHPELARKFVEFITSERGQAVFKKHHYTLTEPK